MTHWRWDVMSTHRAHIVLPSELIAQIDEAVGPRGRSAFLVEVAQAELRKRRTLALLDAALKDAIWKDGDRPELAARSDDWVRSLREEKEGRVREAEAQRNEASA